MSEITPITPQNTNLLHANKFLLAFSRVPNVQYFCQSLPLPGLSMGEGLQTTPFVDLYVPGDKLLYDMLAITFVVDEDLKSWMEIHDWMRAMTFPTDFKEYARMNQLHPPHTSKIAPQYSDAALVILNSSQNSNYRVTFKNCYPTSLSAIQFSTTGQGPLETMTADATFRYDYYNIGSTHN